MTLGFMLTFFDFRNDVRALIKCLCQNHEVVIFIKKEHEQLVSKYLIPGMSYRIIDEYIPSKSNIALTRFFLLFKKLPKSKNNYYLSETYKAEALSDSKQQKKALSIISIQQKLPHFYAYDTYLQSIKYSGKTDLSGIDKMIVFTEIYDDFLYARLLREQFTMYTYVYSWDHACKHVRFSKKVHYLVWNQGIAEDLKLLQQIPDSNITIFGSTQMCYLEQFKSQPKTSKPDYTYFYYGCGIGLSSMVEQEIEVIEILYDCIMLVNPNAVLLVRPYPNFNNWDMYKRLLSKSNIQLDDSYKQADLSIKDNDIQHKFNTIQNADAFFHVGTTLGLEACFTDTPSFLLDISTASEHKIGLYQFVHQYQNEKYLVKNNTENVIKSKQQLLHTLQNITLPIYYKFNTHIAEQFEIKSFEQLAQQIVDLK